MAKKIKKPAKVQSKSAKKDKPKKEGKASKAAKPSKLIAKAKSPVKAKKADATPKAPTKSVKSSPKTVLNSEAIAAKSKKPIKKSGKEVDEDGVTFDDFDDHEDETPADNFKNKTQDELNEIRELLGEALAEDSDEVQIALRDAEGRLYCKVRECDELSLVDSYCRLHYIKLWKKIQLRKKILTDGKLEKYIEELTQRYPDKYIDMLRDDLKTEKSFLSTISELEIEEANEEAEMDDDQQGLIDEVRGIQPAGSGDTDDDSY